MCVCVYVCVLSKQVMTEHFAAEEGLVTEAEVLCWLQHGAGRQEKLLTAGEETEEEEDKRDVCLEVEKAGGSRVMSLLNLSLCNH